MKQAKIKDICIKGSSGLKQKDLLSDGKYPVYGASGVSGYLNSFHQEEPYIGIVKDGSGIGRVDFYPEKTSLIGTLQYILPKEGYEIRYIGYCLQSLDLSKYKQGAAIPHIYFRDYGERIVNVTDDLQEQQRIVAMLDASFAEIDQLKVNAEKQLSEAKALFQKVLAKAMTPKEGWEEKTVGELFETYAGGTPIKSNNDFYEGGNIPWIRSGEVCQKFITKCEVYITEKGMRNSSAKYFPVDTVLIAMYGATAAQVGILKIKATTNQAVCGLLPNEKFNPIFVYYWFKNIQEDLASQAQGGAQPNLSQIKIKKVKIPLIPLSKQQKIVEHLDALSEQVKQLEAIATKTATECDALKQALLRQVFE